MLECAYLNVAHLHSSIPDYHVLVQVQARETSFLLRIAIEAAEQLLNISGNSQSARKLCRRDQQDKRIPHRLQLHAWRRARGGIAGWKIRVAAPAATVVAVK